MGIISLEKADHLYWLGRYTERVFTTLDTFFKYYDTMIDMDDLAYEKYCACISIPNIYKDKDDFINSYAFSAENPDSIYSNMTRALDNAIVLRDELGSATLSYLQMALERIEKASTSRTILYHMQTVLDMLYAFWGCLDDKVVDEESRNIIKVGKYVERLDLYMRLDYSYKAIEKEYTKLLKRMPRVHRGLNMIQMDRLGEIVSMGDAWTEKRSDALDALGKVF